MKLTILLVEDDEALLESLRESLMYYDYKIFTASNGKEALQCLDCSERPVDVIVTDLMMPVMDGYEFVIKLREHTLWRKIPVIVLTSKTDSPDREAAMSRGITDVLKKPVKIRNLVLGINRAMVKQQEFSVDIKTQE